jgi:DHA3 family macrolide efflux protein-like MFS transporter
MASGPKGLQFKAVDQLVMKVPALQKAGGEQNTGYFDDLKAGLAYIRQSRAIMTLFIFFAFVFFLATPVIFLTPLLVTRSFGEEVWRLTANEVTFFVGSIIGGIIMTAWGGFKNHFRTIGLSCVLWAILFTGLGLSQNFVVYLIFMFLAGIPMPLFNVPTITLLQEMVRPDMQGRVFGVQQMIATTILPVGMLIFGPIADVISIEILLVLSSALMAIPGIWIFFNGKLSNSTVPGRILSRNMQEVGRG